jgi:predicted  nucleic acid-binding Zn-ribbon protein
MKEELIKLVTLQKFDQQILEIEDHLTDLIKDIDTADKRLAKARQQTEEKEEKVKKLKVQSENLDTEVASIEAQYKENNYQLMTLKDTKAYESMKLQMEELLNSKEAKENSGIDILNSIEEEEKTLAMYHEKINAEDERIQGLRDQLETEKGKRAEEKEELVQKRKGYAESVNPKLLADYTRLLGMPDRKAIATVDPNSRACYGCYSTVTRENLENIKAMGTIVNCNSCGRILYIPSLLGSAED